MEKLLTNENELKGKFNNDDTFLIDTIYYKDTRNILCKLYYLDGMCDNEKIVSSIIKPIKENNSVTNYIYNPKVKICRNIKDAVGDILTGSAVLLMPSKEEFYVIDVKKVHIRGIDEPTGEKIVKGPRDGFIENIVTNICLVRSHIKNASLKVNYLELKGIDKGKIAIVYLEEYVDYNTLHLTKQRISKAINTTGVEINNLKEKIKDNPYSVFKTIGDTQRPDVATFKLMEGKILVLLDGSPVVIYLPYSFKENFHTVDDYYTNYVFASFNRLFRFISFLLTILVPGLYVALMMYHQELLPTKLLLSIAASREGVPFPTIIECFILLALFEILKEAGSKVSSLFGSALSIVGALIIGQATVDARIVSTSVVIVVAVASVTGLTTPKLSSASIFLRSAFLILGGLIGIYGIIIGIVLLITYLASVKSFNKYYVSKLFTFNLKEYEETYLRLPKVEK